MTSSAHRAATQCVDAAAVIGYRADRLGLRIPLEKIAAWVAESPERRMGFTGIDPLAADAHGEIERALEAGLSGVVLSPADQGCRPTHERFRTVLERCSAAGLCVMVTNPGLARPESILEFASPMLLDEACRDMPGLTLVIGDVGRHGCEVPLVMAEKHARVFIELSTVASRPFALRHMLITAHERGLMHKLLFASGFPDEAPERAIERMYGLCGFASTSAAGGSGLPREAVRSVVERDSFTALGIDRLRAGGVPTGSVTPTLPLKSAGIAPWH